MKMSCYLCHRPVRMKALTGIECDKQVWHKRCFQCSVCSLQLSLHSYKRHDERLYCYSHFPGSGSQRIKPPGAAVAQLPLPPTITQRPLEDSFSYQAPVPVPVNRTLPVNACWFYHDLDRVDAEKLLERDGDFLVRTSKGRQGEYVVTVQWNSKPHNFICPKTENGGWNFNGVELRKLEDWVQKHVETGKPVCPQSGAKLLRPIQNQHFYDEITDSVPNLRISGKYQPTVRPVVPEVPAQVPEVPVQVPTVPAQVPTFASQPPPPVLRRGTSCPNEEAAARPPSRVVSVSEKRRGLAARGPTQSMIDDISFEIVTGNICQMKVDVIVNSVGTHMNLRQGALSSALLAIAGDDMQTELSRLAPAFYVKPGDVFVTKGYNLNCKHVIHAVCYRFKDGGQSTVQGYRELIKSILAEADKLKATSIAIPPIGTGALGYPATIVAKVMTEEIAAFSESCSHPTLNDIRFVMLDTDVITYKAFRAALQPDGDTGDSEEINVEDIKAQRAAVEAQKIGNQGIDIPSHWMSKESGKPYEKYELVPLSNEYNAVVKNMSDRDGLPFIPYIYKIERIENRAQYTMYEVQKSVLGQRNDSGTINEHILWHGTSLGSLESICQYGFNRAFCGKNGVIWGKGVYYAHDFSYSARNVYSPPDTQGLKYVIQCRVLTGDYVKGDPDLVAPPEKSPGIQYDSAVDDVDDPRIFVVFYDYRTYPEYIISFFG